jgi:prepilin-type N-terminal cleavage/methylation domain-containing protein
MGARGRKAFTLIELLIVIVIVMLLAALLLPALIRALCNGRAAAARHLISQMELGADQYEKAYGVYPAGKGDGSKELAYYLQKKGARNQQFFEFQEDQLLNGNVINPVWGADGDAPSNIIFYRNNFVATGAPPAGGGGGMPPVYNKSRFDMWCAGCDFGSGKPEANWGVNNWQ